MTCSNCGTRERETRFSQSLDVMLCGPCFGALADRFQRGATSIAPGDLEPSQLHSAAESSNGAGLEWPEDEPSTWAPVDLAPILSDDGELEPPPAILPRSDKERLLYRGKIHSVAGEPEAGKGWLVLLACKDRIEAGEHVAYFDFEDEAPVAVDRLRALGLDDAAIRERFHYIRPDEPLDAAGRAEIERLLAAKRPALAVLDGLTEALALHGIDLRDNTEVAKWLGDLPGGLRRRGIAVVLIDHVSKDADSRGRYSIGAQHKLGKADVHYSLIVKEPFGRGMEGRVLIRVEKDRPGHIRRLARYKMVAEMIGGSLPGGALDLALEPPREGAESFRPTGYMVKVSRAVEDEPGLSISAIRAAVPGKSEFIDRARELLVREGFIEARKDGQATRHHPIQPFSEDGNDGG